MAVNAFPPSPGEPSPPGQPELVDGRYALVRLLGSGGSGEVFEAVHTALGKRFALKRLHSAADASALARFRREAAVLGRLEHPHVVGVSDFGVDAGGRPYLVMELLDGISLAERCAEGALPPDEALPILEAVAAALDHAHREGLLHRDLKPANVVLRRKVDGWDVRVVDFGLVGLAGPGDEDGVAGPPFAMYAPEGLTHESGFLGTLPYSAPELLRGEPATRASDLYAFAVMAYEALCGRRPFCGSGEEIVAAHLRAVPPDATSMNGALPPEVGACLRDALAKSPAQRFESAGALIAALRAAFARARERTRHARAWPRRLGTATLIGLGAAAAGAGAAALPAGRSLERWFEDARMALAPSRAPDRRLLLVSLDDADNAPALSERADEVARGISAVLGAGARGVAIDVLLPARWGESAAFTELVLAHGDRLTLAVASSGAGQPAIGTECLTGLATVALGRERAASLFGFVNIEEDTDGIVRRLRTSLRDGDGRERPTWAARAAGMLEVRASTNGAPIDFASDWRRLERLSWPELQVTAQRTPQRIQGRLVLIGGDFLAAGDDRHRIPGRRGPEMVSGLVLQALAIDTLLAGRPSARTPALWIPLIIGLAGMALAILWPGRRRPAATGLLVAIVFVGQLALACVYLDGQRVLVPVVAPLAAGLVAVGAALVLQRRLEPVGGKGVA